MKLIPSDGADLYVEDMGSGTPILFLHEMGGTCRSWAPQLRHFETSHRCIAYNARGYPPSTVPQDYREYSQKIAVRDALALLDALDIERAHIVGLSMGSFATLQFALDHPERALSLTVAGCGSGSPLAGYEASRHRYEVMAQSIEDGGFSEFVEGYVRGPARRALLRRDPESWNEFAEGMRQASPVGLACTLRGVQARRPSLWDLEERLVAMKLATLLVCGDQDEPCLVPNLFLNRVLPDSRLFVFGDCGHAVNQDEPALFNRTLRDFIEHHE